MSNCGRYITSIDIVNKTNEYPFTIPSIAHFQECKIHEHVTYFIGDNGSGKSTLLEAIAIALRINAEGGNRNTRYSLLKTESNLSKHILITKTGRVIPDAFFFRAETLFSLFVAAHNDEVENPGFSWGVHGWNGIEKMSHGEGHLEIIMNKMNTGVYIFDEPESGLGIEKQFQFISEVDRLVKNGSQVIVATHAPVILSYPHSTIYALSATGCSVVQYEESKPFQLMKMFMGHHKKMVKELTSD